MVRPIFGCTLIEKRNVLYNLINSQFRCFVESLDGGNIPHVRHKPVSVEKSSKMIP